MEKPNEFDICIERRGTLSRKYHTPASKDEAFVFSASVADMDFRVCPAVREALQKTLDHGIFGYDAYPEGLVSALVEWMSTRHGWKVAEEHVLHAPNVVNILALAAVLFTRKSQKVIVQPPTYTRFFEVLQENDRVVEVNPLVLEEGRYHMDFKDLEEKASHPDATLLYL